MELYKDEPKFDPRTGKPDGTHRIWKETRCDFSGRVVRSCEDPNLCAYECRIDLDYEDQDPCFGSGGEEYAFGQKYKVDTYAFLNDGYVIYCNWEDDDYSATMKEFMKALKEHETFAAALRSMRVATAIKLIESGEIKAEDLRGR